ncbi:hypothetical protein M8J76_012821 [Diaphorina citri]|nr:hypothetical protein M8J75_013319 [Diaphorina citri]KAI5745621.1 hypothetical protein M8J76_012821 [Diaphorina citri]
MRINLKASLASLCILVCIATLSLWTRCTVDENLPVLKKSEQGSNSNEVKDIDCHINGDYTVGCKREGEEVYVPFSFIHKYFEVSGKLVNSQEAETFEWAHCNARVYHPKSKYDPKGVFAYFDNYKVEDRERVKCVSGIEGVPVTTQWDPNGYYYPTQIAQFGLSHYSKNLTEPEPKRTVLEDGDSIQGDWVVPNSGGYAGRQYNQLVNSYVLNFHTSEGQTVSLKLNHGSDFILGVTLSILSNSSLSVALENSELQEMWRLHYVCSRDLITARGQDIYYGIGCSSTWQTLTRDLLIDVQKGVLLQEKKRKIKLVKSKFKVTHIHLYGSGSIDNLTLSTSDHMAQFYATAEWLVNHQDPKTGGWPNPVRRRITAGIGDLKPGWYSAMGQGHAISVLSRAYYHSGGNVTYLNTALRALKVFKLPIYKGGVQSKFLDKFPWYEEYPTTPAVFILNGFIYSLFGLYDLVTLSPRSKQKEALSLYDQGITSLKRMLNMYDTGSGSSYDLRHISLGIAPKIARCDYHATHVNQLLLLATIEKDKIISDTGQRWAGYIQGKRASHN